MTGLLIGGLAGCGGSSAYTYSTPNSVVIADFKGNGLPGVAVASAQIDQTSSAEQPGFVAVILQNPSSPGTFEPSVHYAIDGNPSALAVGEIAAAGSVDLAVANFNRGTISVLLETAPGSGTFQNQRSVPTGGSPSDLAICDVNGDGHPDFVVSDGTTLTGGNLIVILQNPAAAGEFEAAVKVAQTPTYAAGGATVPDPAYGIACGNLNGDGHSMDVVMTSLYRNFTTSYAYGASAMLSIFFHDPSNPGAFLPRRDIAIPGILHRVKIADVNHDGLPDIIVSNEGAGSDGIGAPGVVVLLQNTPPGSATPSFASPVTYASDSAVSLAVADVNGAGLPDLVIASGYANADAVEVMLNNASSPGTFSTPTSYAGLGNPASVAIGDLNHDGLPDIATADGTGAVVYFQNSGASAGTFRAGQQIGN